MVKHTTISFKQRVEEKFPNKYDLTKVEYIDSKTKTIVGCKIHGDFMVSPTKLISGRSCKVCGHIRRSEKRLEKVKGEFKGKSSIIHNNRYDYSQFVYKNATTKGKIICGDHSFLQTPNDHLQGKGCPSCKNKEQNERKKQKAGLEFPAKARAVHGNKYDYSEVDYVNNSTKVKIIHEDHSFMQTPAGHLEGRGCRKCNQVKTNTFKPSEKDSGILYYLRVVSPDGLTTAYKIGITKYSVMKRYTTEELSRITILKTVDYDNMLEAYKEEQRIMKQFVEQKYKGEDLLKTGNTELFFEDVLELDKLLEAYKKGLE